jgi:hypothetical protein
MVGFLEVHNRINVAMSRAKVLLIIVGDSQTVRSNRVLRQVFEGFRRSGAIIPWHRLPGVGKGTRRRRGGRTRPGAQTVRPQVVIEPSGTQKDGDNVESGDHQADATDAPRRLPRLRDWQPGETLPAVPAGAEEVEAGTTAPRQETPAVGSPRRSRRRRRRRPRRRGPRPEGQGQAADGVSTQGGTPTSASPTAPPAEGGPGDGTGGAADGGIADRGGAEGGSADSTHADGGGADRDGGDRGGGDGGSADSARAERGSADSAPKVA